MKKRIAIILTTLLIACNGVFAHPGRTDSNGCHTCRTNCSKYGLKTGEYHCHDGSSSEKTTTSNKSNTKTSTTKKSTSTTTNTKTTTKNSTSSTNNTKKTTVTKSSDNSLKSIEIDGKKIDLDKLEYTTYNQSITLYVTAKHSAAKVDYEKQIDLEIGENKINIEVTAEDGIKKTYTVVVIREEEQVVITSSNNVENVIYEEDIIGSKNDTPTELTVQNPVLEQTKQDDIGLGDLLITSGVCGLGYLGYKKYKKKKK